MRSTGRGVHGGVDDTLVWWPLLGALILETMGPWRTRVWLGTRPTAPTAEPSVETEQPPRSLAPDDVITEQPGVVDAVPPGDVRVVVPLPWYGV